METIDFVFFLSCGLLAFSIIHLYVSNMAQHLKNIHNALITSTLQLETNSYEVIKQEDIMSLGFVPYFQSYEDYGFANEDDKGYITKIKLAPINQVTIVTKDSKFTQSFMNKGDLVQYLLLIQDSVVAGF
ncbi:hypothetical protein MUN82_01850 [Hymenobacter aerilatus]|uniref:Uncharacterized protein n=1 Tax=Hymenobacter aerilatus TaxID=2932251 RepID=A0A8T9SY55_9BACT|nr:hypothetical protein [Hymenobacter aerilatus]UOR05854.1 hypothetical protein MUN82_01850 [Hymenobacter aerilatus]